MSLAWLTPDTLPETTVCRVIQIPDDPFFIYAVNGALLNLTYHWHWEKFGAVEPEQAAARMAQLLQEYFDSQCQSGMSKMVGAIVFVVEDVSPLPENILLCDGSVMLREDWPELYQFFVDTDYPFIIDADSATLPEFTPETTTWVGLGSTNMLYAIVAG